MAAAVAGLWRWDWGMAVLLRAALVPLGTFDLDCQVDSQRTAPRSGVKRDGYGEQSCRLSPYPYHAVGPRVVALVATVLTGLYVVVVLGFGYAIVTTDWSALVCFDGSEPACKGPDRGPATLADIRTSSWVLAVLSVICVVGSGIVGLRLRRARYLAGVVALCLTAVVAASLLWMPAV